MRILLTCLLGLSVFISGCKNSGNNSPIINYTVTNTFPHDTSSFTEGFLVHDGHLFESTGSPEPLVNTRSLIGIVDLKTGKIDKKVEIDKTKYFGEGIVFFKDKLYQLT